MSKKGEKTFTEPLAGIQCFCYFCECFFSFKDKIGGFEKVTGTLSTSEFKLAEGFAGTHIDQKSKEGVVFVLSQGSNNHKNGFGIIEQKSILFFRRVLCFLVIRRR